MWIRLVTATPSSNPCATRYRYHELEIYDDTLSTKKTIKRHLQSQLLEYPHK